MGSETEGGVLDMHFGNNTDVDICRISLVEKNTYDHYKKNSLVKSSELLACCLGMRGCMSITLTEAIETLLGLPPLELLVCYFQDGRFPSFTGSF
jgi:hypothetical protein